MMFISQANLTGRKRCLQLFILLTLTLFLSISCGGGGGGGSSSGGGGGGEGGGGQGGGGGTSSVSTGAVLAGEFIGDVAMQLSESVEYADEAGGMEMQSLAMAKGISITRKTGTKKGRRLKALSIVSTQQTTACPRGGTMDVQTEGLNKRIITYSDCKAEIEPGVESYQDGVITITVLSMTEMTVEFDNFIYRLTRISTGVVMEEYTLNSTLDYTLNGTASCGGINIPASFSLIANGTNSLKVDDDEDGTYDTDYTSTFRDFAIDMIFNEFDAGCSPVDITLTFGGGIDFDDHIINVTYSMDISDSDPLVNNMQFGNDGDTVTLDGTFTIDISCFNGTVTVNTTTPAFYPADSECPTSGEVVVTGDLTGTITFTSSGGVEIDNGSDGTVDETYSDCHEPAEQACEII